LCQPSRFGSHTRICRGTDRAMPAAARQPEQRPATVGGDLEDGRLHQRGDCRQTRAFGKHGGTETEPDSPHLVRAGPRTHDPGMEGEDPLRLEREADALCDRFEEAYLAGGRPDLDSWLPSDQRLRQAALPHLALLDLECRVLGGDAIRVEDY